jgi:type VI protein secretion system component VasK
VTDQPPLSQGLIRWLTLIIAVPAAATGWFWHVSTRLGLTLACVTVVVMVTVIVFAYRRGRAAREAGYRQDSSELAAQMRRHARHSLLGAAVTGVGCLILLLDNHRHLPGWVLLAPPAFILLGAGYLWGFASYLERHPSAPSAPQR